MVNPKQIFCGILFYLNSLMIKDFSKLMIPSEIFNYNEKCEMIFRLIETLRVFWIGSWLEWGFFYESFLLKAHFSNPIKTLQGSVKKSHPTISFKNHSRDTPIMHNNTEISCRRSNKSNTSCWLYNLSFSSFSIFHSNTHHYSAAELI